MSLSTKFPIACILFLLTFVSGLWTGQTAVAQSNPEALRSELMIESVLATQGTPVRLVHDPTTDFLYYLTIDGRLYRIPPPYRGETATQVYSAADHGLGSNVLGFTIAQDGTFYLVGNRVQGATNTGIIKRGTPQGNGHVWSTVAESTPYPRSNTPFDHNFNAVAVSPDGNTLYVNSGSRTDHGELQSHNGQFPGVREVPLTSIILRIPANSTDLVLPDDAATLQANGYLFADGVRNSFDLVFDANGNLFGTENAGDRSDNEELNWLREGHHYGFPWRMGLHDTPQQFAGYDPSQDQLLPPSAFAVTNGFFYDDATYPAPPAGVTFTDPIRNLGPDANLFQDTDGTVRDGVTAGIPVATLTPHRSPLGLVFDTANQLPAPFLGHAFVVSWTAPNEGLMQPFGDEGEDLLWLRFQQTQDNYEVEVERIAKGFQNPIDAVLVGGRLYILEFGNGGRIWEVTFSADTATENPDLNLGFQLQVFPNPTTSEARVALALTEAQEIEVTVYNVLGQSVGMVHRGLLTAQHTHRLTWPATDWPAGTYFVQVRGRHGQQTKPLFLVK